MTAAAETTYGAGAEELLTKLSMHPAITSVQGSGWTAVNGKATTREYAPGGFEKLIRALHDQGLPYSGDAIVAVDEEKSKIAEDVIAAMAEKGWQWLHSNPSGRKVTLWLARTPRKDTYYQLTKTTTVEGASELKDGSKRNRMASPTNSPHQGSFITWKPSPSETIFTPEGLETTSTELWLPNGEMLRVLALPEEYNANDGDALLRTRAVDLLSDVCGLAGNTDRMTFVQFLISGQDSGLKALGQTEYNVRWPEGYEEYDILIGAEGILPRTKRDVTIGKVTARYPSRRASGIIFVDGFASVPNILIRYYEPSVMVSYGRATAVARLLKDQVQAIELHEDNISVWHADDMELPEAAPRTEQIEDPWLDNNRKEKEFGIAARDTFGSVFAHPASLGMNARSVANRLRGMVRRNTTSRDGREGTPGAVLPGAKLKLAHWFLAGVEEPEYDEINVGWLESGKPNTFSIAPKRWAEDAHRKASDGDDCDDEENIIAGATEKGGNVTAVVGRTPSSPGGGEHFTMNRDGEQWRDYTVVMPLRESFGKNPEGFLDAEPAFQMGPRVETQSATTDLLEILEACRFSAGQAKYIGQCADALQALHMSGVPADEIAYVTSDLLDNVWNQQYDGIHIVREIHRYCVERVRRGEPWFRPIYVRIASAVNELHNELYGTDANPKYGSYPHWEEMFTGMRGTNDVTDVLDLTLAARCNGPVEALTEPVDARVALIGAALVKNVREAWRAWGKTNNSIRRQKGVKRSEKDKRVADLTRSTLDRIQALTDRAYELAQEGDYIPGSLTCAVRQAGIAFGERWERPTNSRTPTLKSRQLLPKAEHKILPGLPLRETMAHYGNGERPEPAWMTRLMPSATEPDLLPGDEVVVERSESGQFQVRRLGTTETIATLRTEGYGLVDLTAKFVGWLHRYDDVRKADADFYGAPIAIFRTSHREVLGQLRNKAANAAEALKDLSY